MEWNIKDATAQPLIVKDLVPNLSLHCIQLISYMKYLIFLQQ